MLPLLRIILRKVVDAVSGLRSWARKDKFCDGRKLSSFIGEVKGVSEKDRIGAGRFATDSSIAKQETRDSSNLEFLTQI